MYPIDLMIEGVETDFRELFQSEITTSPFVEEPSTNPFFIPPPAPFYIPQERDILAVTKYKQKRFRPLGIKKSNKKKK